jgi:hypothetical protein
LDAVPKFEKASAGKTRAAAQRWACSWQCRTRIGSMKPRAHLSFRFKWWDQLSSMATLAVDNDSGVFL